MDRKSVAKSVFSCKIVQISLTNEKKFKDFIMFLFPGIPDQFPGKREGQKSQISREFPSREFPGGNSSWELASPATFLTLFRVNERLKTDFLP